MKKRRRPWPAILQRGIHDAWSSLRPAPEMIEDGLRVADDSRELIEAGEVAVSQEDESLFHNTPLPPLVTRWGRTTWSRLRHAHVVGDQGHVFRADGRFVHICPSMRRLDPEKIRRPIPWLARRVEGAVFHLTGRDHENHGHFVMQHLPRLLAARPLLAELDIHPSILVAAGHEKWQSRYLGALGYDAQHVIACGTGTTSVEELHYVPMLWDAGPLLGPPRLYVDLQTALRRWAGVSEDARPGSRPIFVSREDAPTRRLSNEAEIIGVCRRLLGEVDVMHLPKVPFADQIRRFAETPLVIGPQGQGLTNIIFSRGARMLILEAGQSSLEGGWACSYRDFAAMTGNSALRLLSGLPWPNDGDWSFPVESFERQLKRVLALGLDAHRPQNLL